MIPQPLSGECNRRAVNRQGNDHYKELTQGDKDLRKDVGSCARWYSLGAISWKNSRHLAEVRLKALGTLHDGKDRLSPGT